MPDPTPLSQLPRIDDLVAAADDLVAAYGRTAATAALRRAVEGARQGILADRSVTPDADSLLAAAHADLVSRRPGPPRRVVNATGVVVHTNLGRAPLSSAARAAVADAAGACDLEFDLGSGGRGSRTARLEPLLVDATGAQAATVVNNAAAALVLVLAALASGREVLVSRGELVEIGGSFRLPEIMGASGATLVEVGTTNRTRAADYAAAGTDVALILKVHTSNYRISGFVEEAGVAELAEVAASRGVPLVHDVGSGLLTEPDVDWLEGEPSLAGSLAGGADLVIASGDKLLGGPQAGLLAGRADLVDTCRRHPLARALRLDKLRVAALAATLEAHLRGTTEELPTWRMLLADIEEVTARAEAIARHLAADVVAGTSLVGGGSAPDRAVPTSLVRWVVPSPDLVATGLREGTPAVIVRVEDGAVVVDPRTVDPADDGLLLQRLTDVAADAGVSLQAPR